jgi:FkbM family methyltransferase
MIEIMHLGKKFIKAIILRILFPRFNGNYYYLNRNKIYRAPSLRQISIIRQFVKAQWKPSSFKRVEKLLELVGARNPIILDIGGNVGYYSIVYGKLLNAYQGRCISFEPASINSLAFLYNTRGQHNIHLFTFGLGAIFESLSLAMPKYAKSNNKDMENTGLLSALVEANDDNVVYKSSAFPLDSIVDGVINKKERIIFVKIDVEGYELPVIRGGIETIRNHMPVIEIEFNTLTSSLQDLQEILNTLYHLGYVTFSSKPFNINVTCQVFFVDSSDLNIVMMFSKSKELYAFHFIK